MGRPNTQELIKWNGNLDPATLAPHQWSFAKSLKVWEWERRDRDYYPVVLFQSIILEKCFSALICSNEKTSSTSSQFHDLGHSGLKITQKVLFCPILVISIVIHFEIHIWDAT